MADPSSTVEHTDDGTVHVSQTRLTELRQAVDNADSQINRIEAKVDLVLYLIESEDIP